MSWQRLPRKFVSSNPDNRRTGEAEALASGKIFWLEDFMHYGSGGTSYSERHSKVDPGFVPSSLSLRYYHEASNVFQCSLTTCDKGI